MSGSNTPIPTGEKPKRRSSAPIPQSMKTRFDSEDAVAGPSTSQQVPEVDPGFAGSQPAAQGRRRRRRKESKLKKKGKKGTGGPTTEGPAAAEYVTDFINVGFMDDVARETSRALEIAMNHQRLTELLEQEMERCLSLADKDDEDGDWVDDDDEEMETELSAERAKCLQNIERLLELVQLTADDGVEISANIGKIVEKKSDIMEASSSNLTKVQQKGSGSQQKREQGSSKQTRTRKTPNKGKKRATLQGNIRLGEEKEVGDDVPPPKADIEEGNRPSGSDNAGEKEDKSAVPGPSTPSAATNGGSFTISPARSNASSSSSKKPRGLLSSLDPPSLDDSGYRACKFRNLPNYTGMCANLRGRAKITKRKAPSKMGKRVGRFEGKYSDTESEDDATKDSSPSEKDSTQAETDQPVYCICRKVSAGKMIECDNKHCPVQWFHFKCIGMKKAPKLWYCTVCRGENSTVLKPESNLGTEGKVAAAGLN